MVRFSLIAAFTAVAAVAIAPLQAATVHPFSAAAFEAAQKLGRPILVDVYADWCPVCRAQNEVLSRLLPGREFKNLTVFKLNFDTQKDARSRLGAQRQSTLIVFRGNKELGRSVAVTDSASIERLVRSGLR